MKSSPGRVGAEQHVTADGAFPFTQTFQELEHHTWASNPGPGSSVASVLSMLLRGG